MMQSRANTTLHVRQQSDSSNLAPPPGQSVGATVQSMLGIVIVGRERAGGDIGGVRLETNLNGLSEQFQRHLKQYANTILA